MAINTYHKNITALYRLRNVYNTTYMCYGIVHLSYNNVHYKIPTQNKNKLLRKSINITRRLYIVTDAYCHPLVVCMFGNVKCVRFTLMQVRCEYATVYMYIPGTGCRQVPAV